MHCSRNSLGLLHDALLVYAEFLLRINVISLFWVRAENLRAQSVVRRPWFVTVADPALVLRGFNI